MNTVNLNAVLNRLISNIHSNYHSLFSLFQVPPILFRNHEIGIVIMFMSEQSKLQSTLSKPGLNAVLVMRIQYRRFDRPSIM